MRPLDSGFVLSAQVFRPENSGFYGRNYVTSLEHSGPGLNPWGRGGDITFMIEDRDKLADLSRGARFHPLALAEVYEKAAAVLAVLYRRPGQRERLGQELHTKDHAAAVDATLAKGGVRIFIKTTNDRLSYWAQISRLLAPSDCEFRYTDSDGAARITGEWGEVAA